MMKSETIDRIRKFTEERDWDKFHSPSNLAKSIVIEAAELLECFQWSDEEYDLQHIREELADVIVYDSGFVKVVDLAELADMLDEGVITEELVKKCLRRLEKLLEIIYGGNFDELTKYLEIEGSK